MSVISSNSYLSSIAPKGENVQVNPASVDVSVQELYRLTQMPMILKENGFIPEDVPVEVHTDDIWWLKGNTTYIAVLAEEIQIPITSAALFVPRSRLMRSGIWCNTGWYDPGYKGYGRAMLQVSILGGAFLQRGSRIGQLIFFELDKMAASYNGQFQNEGVK